MTGCRCSDEVTWLLRGLYWVFLAVRWLSLLVVSGDRPSLWH